MVFIITITIIIINNINFQVPKCLTIPEETCRDIPTQNCHPVPFLKPVKYDNDDDDDNDNDDDDDLIHQEACEGVSVLCGI